MIFGMYAMFDKKVGFMTPTIDNNDAIAIRAFHYAIKKDNFIGTHYSDFELYKIAEYDNDTGIIKPIDKVLLAEGRKVEDGN